MGGHVVQRALLLVLVGCFAIYTIVNYISTRNVLTQCAAYSMDDTGSVIPSSQVVLSDPGSWHRSNGAQGLSSPNDDGAANIAIGKVTMSYGSWAEDESNKLILEGHKQHAEKHGYSFHVLGQQTMHGLWSKLSYMLKIILEELEKPESKRIQWLFWFDLDIIVMNANVPLSIFLPPGGNYPHINLLVTNDHNGLNSGAFFIRVNEWAVRYLIDVLALRSFKPEVTLKYSDQSAMEIITLNSRYVNNTMYVPQRWFNAYRGPRDDRERLLKGVSVPENTIKPGDLQIHFAGKKVKHLVPTYLALAANESSGWSMPLENTRLELETARFWKLESERHSWNRPV